MLAMVAGAFGMMMPTASAEIVDKYNDRAILIDYTNLNNDPNFGNYPIYPGSQEVNFYINVHNYGGDIMSDDNPIYYANLSVNTLLRNEAGTLLTTSTNPVTWTTTRDDAEETLWESGMNSHTFTDFEFDVKANAVPGIYNLTVILDYKNDVGSPFNDIVGFIHFEIRNRVEVPDSMGNFNPGGLNVPVTFQMYFDDYMGTNLDQDDEVSDVSISITLPDTDFWWFGESGATISRTNPGPFEGQWDGDSIPNYWNIPLKLSVSPSKDKGEYSGPYTLTYKTSD
jgi:hypothetical protein